MGVGGGGGGETDVRVTAGMEEGAEGSGWGRAGEHEEDVGEAWGRWWVEGRRAVERSVRGQMGVGGAAAAPGCAAGGEAGISPSRRATGVAGTKL